MSLEVSYIHGMNGNGSNQQAHIGLYDSLGDNIIFKSKANDIRARSSNSFHFNGDEIASGYHESTEFNVTVNNINYDTESMEVNINDTDYGEYSFYESASQSNSIAIWSEGIDGIIESLRVQI